jgi:hypothetical protein
MAQKFQLLQVLEQQQLLQKLEQSVEQAQQFNMVLNKQLHFQDLLQMQNKLRLKS